MAEIGTAFVDVKLDDRQVGRQVDGIGSKIGGTLGKVGVAAAAGLGIGLVAGLGAAVKAAGNFESALNTLQAVTGANDKQMDALGKKAKDLGRDITLPGTSARDAADAMTELAKGGLSVNQTMAASKGVLQLSAAAQISNADAATYTAQALNSFGLAGKDATKVADLLAATANASASEITDVAQGMQQAAAVFKMGRQPIDALTVSLGLMSNAGVSGSDAGTSLKTMMLSLQAPTNKAAETMGDLGINTRDAQGHMLPMRDLVQEFTSKTSGLGDAQRDAALKTIFGTDAIRAANIVMTGGVEKWDKMHDATTKGGEAAALAEAKMKGFNGSMESLKSSLETIAITVGTRLLPPLTAGLAVVAGWVAQLDVFLSSGESTGGMVDGLAAKFPTLAAAISGVASTVGQVAGFIRTHWESISTAFTTVAQAVGVVIGFVILKVREIAAAIRAHSEEIKATLQALHAIFNTVWPAIRAIIQAAWSQIKIIVDTALKVIGDLIRVVMAVIRGDWQTAWSALAAAGKAILSGFVQLAKNLLMNLAPALLSLALTAGKAIVLGIARGLVGLAVALVTGLANVVKTAITSTANAVLDLAMAIGKKIIEGAKAGVLAEAGNLKSAVEGVVSGALSNLNPFSPVEHGGEKYIGRPIADGAIRGWILGSASLPTKIADGVRKAVEAGQKVVEAARGRFAAAWAGISSDALSAFDAINGAVLTKSEKILAAMDLADKVKGINDRIAEAQTQLAGAGTAEEQLAAQANLDAALREQQRFNLEQKAIEERKQLDASTALKRRHFEEDLLELQTRLAREGATHEQAQKQILALFGRYGVKFKAAAKALGNAFLTGLKEELADAVSAAQATANAIEKALRGATGAAKSASKSTPAGAAAVPANLAAATGPLAATTPAPVGATFAGQPNPLRDLASSLTATSKLTSSADTASLLEGLNVRVFIGDRELTDLVRTEVSSHDSETARSLLAAGIR